MFGLAIAYASGTLFTIWNLKGYFDTIPKELEEAVMTDGASVTQTFLRSFHWRAGLAATVLFAFMTGWIEFVLLDIPGIIPRFTLSMVLGDGLRFAAPWWLICHVHPDEYPDRDSFFALQRYLRAD